jgi:hypothetical protein
MNKIDKMIKTLRMLKMFKMNKILEKNKIIEDFKKHIVGINDMVIVEFKYIIN